ncbi:kinase-like domain-containing protein [Xylaria castorea]|nr:kinase-like domain-containing protein [Xylaria castorea]
MPPRPSSLFRTAKRRLDQLKHYIAPMPTIQYVRALGYGGNGLAIRFRETRRNFDFVMKIALGGWESRSIRTEIQETRKLDKAAHCVQMIPRDAVGLPLQRPFAWDYPDEDDSSDPEEESSGEESRDDGPGPDVPRTRRPMNRAERTAATRKRIRHERRMAGAYTNIRNRQTDITRRRRRGIPPPDEEDDPELEENRKDFILLEFCENGDLEHLIYRLGEVDAIIPNRILWGFWLCMVRSCVAMQFPPRKFHPRRRDAPQYTADGMPIANNRLDGKTVGRDLYEEIPVPRRRWAEKRQVHFDIDPQNILISGIDVYAADNEHKIIPKLKMADFGNAIEIKPRKRNSYYTIMREQAKHGHLTPEQFGIDWDFIRPHHNNAAGAQADIYPEDGAEVGEEPVAGNYGPHSNVWQIALVAWQLMTKMMSPVPPQLQAKSGPHANLPYNYCVALLTERQFDVYDIELRQTIARCMAHDPRDRPPLQQLLRQAQNRINRHFANEPDAIIHQWVQQFIYNA